MSLEEGRDLAVEVHPVTQVSHAVALVGETHVLHLDVLAGRAHEAIRLAHRVPRVVRAVAHEQRRADAVDVLDG